MDNNGIFSDLLQCRVVIVYREEQREKTVAGTLQKAESDFLQVATDSGSTITIARNCVVKVKARNGGF